MDNIPKLKLLTAPLAGIFCIIQNEKEKKKLHKCLENNKNKSKSKK